MPVADPDLKHLEMLVQGSLSAGGSTVKACFNVFCYRRTTFAFPASKGSFTTAFRTAVIVPLIAAASARYSVGFLRARWLSDALDGYLTTADAGVGAIATDSQPNNNSVFFLLRTGLKFGNWRGSKHFGGVNEADTTDNILVGAGLARWEALKAPLLAQITDADGNKWVPEIVSRTLSQLVTNPVNVQAADVSEVLMNKRVGSMAKRKAKSVY